MKGISLYNPWAGLVVLGAKTIETRLHDRFKCLKGQRIFIHASKAYDTSASYEIFNFDNKAEIMNVVGMNEELLLAGGMIIGTVFVKDARWLTAEDSKAALIDCSRTKRFGLILTEPRILVEPYSMRGSQGIMNFDVEDFESFVVMCKGGR